MNEHPILFSGEMVKAILEGRKTQTRRVVNPQPTRKYTWHGCRDGVQFWTDDPLQGEKGNPERVKVPYGMPGDYLWIREKAKLRSIDRRRNGYVDGFDLHYPADDAIIVYPGRDNPKPYTFGKFCPSIHMPRWASRITLQIFDVRVERLHEISHQDVIAEGGPFGYSGSSDEDYFALWDTINAKRGYSAHLNPWVWVVEFKVAK
jgi:hypothetical protein